MQDMKCLLPNLWLADDTNDDDANDNDANDDNANDTTQLTIHDYIGSSA